MTMVVQLLLLFAFAFLANTTTAVFIDNGQQDVGSPLRVAQCRATCLERFSNDDPTGEASCLHGPDCFMCWENCELLQSNFQVWGAMCEEKEICFPGCQQACQFHSSSGTQQTQPVIRTQGEAAVRFRGGRVRWPRPPHVPANTPLVYVVMRRRNADGAWRQLAQTAAQSAHVPPVQRSNSQRPEPLRVLVVNSQGLVTIYSPVDETPESMPGKKRKTINTEVKSKNQSSSDWEVRVISLIHQKVLVISEIAWEPKAFRGVYLVTWEVDGGGLKGNLFTDSTSVTLSLWPDTIYHIQVELVSHTPGLDNLKSEMLDLDTSRAQRVSTETQDDLITSVEEAAMGIEMNGLKERQNAAQSIPLFSLFLDAVRGEPTNQHRRHLEILAGSGAAVLLFILVLAVFIWRYRSYTGATLDSSKIERLEDDFSSEQMDIEPVKTMCFTNGTIVDSMLLSKTNSESTIKLTTAMEEQASTSSVYDRVPASSQSHINVTESQSSDCKEVKV